MFVLRHVTLHGRLTVKQLCCAAAMASFRFTAANLQGSAWGALQKLLLTLFACAAAVGIRTFSGFAFGPSADLHLDLQRLSIRPTDLHSDIQWSQRISGEVTHSRRYTLHTKARTLKVLGGTPITPQVQRTDQLVSGVE